MEDKKEQIRMLVDTGVPKENILKVLQVTDKEFEEALGVPKAVEQTDQELKTLNETLMKEEKQKEIKKVRESRVLYTEELWEEGKALREKGYTIREIAKKQGFSMNFISRMVRCDNYADVAKTRKQQAAIKRAYYNYKSAVSRQPNSRQNRKNLEKEPATEVVEDESESYVQFMVDVGLVLRDIRDQLTRLADNQGAKPIKKHKFWFK